MARELVQIFCKGDKTLNIAIRGDKVTLVHADNDDDSQVWYKDSCFTGNVTDDEGKKAFALVNKATSQVLVNKDLPRPEDKEVLVQLADYNNGMIMNISMLWSEGPNLGDGFHEVRTVRDVKKTLNGLFGFVEGTEVGIYPSSPTFDHAVWKIVTVQASDVA